MLSLAARWLLPAALAVPLASQAYEPDPDSGPPIDLRTAVARSLDANPGLAVAAFDLRAQDGAKLRAGLAPNPELSVDVEDFLGSGTRNDFSAAQTTLSLKQVLERGARARRIEAASAGRDLLDAELREKQMDVAAEAARRFYRVLSDQERLRLTHEASELS
ncbi:MAG: TolC family protein, partial [Panacagrimonas sp.]